MLDADIHGRIPPRPKAPPRRTPPRWRAALRPVVLGAWLLGVASGALLTSGCSRPASEEAAARSESSPRPQQTAPPGATEPPTTGAARATGATEYWDVTFSNEQPVGQAHTRRVVVEEDGATLVRTTSEQTLKIGRSRDVAAQTMKMETWTTLAGDLVRFTSSMDSGDAPIAVEGRVEDHSLHQIVTAGGRKNSTRQNWRPEWGGYFAIERSLEHQPLAPSERRQLTALVPALNMPAEVSLQAADDYRDEPLLQNSAALLQVDVSLQIGNVKLKQVVWCDRKGVAVKQFDPQVGLTTYRSSEFEALAAAQSDASLKLNASIFIPVQGSLGKPHQDSRRRYRVTLKDGRVAEVFPSTPLQIVTDAGANAGEIVVLRQRPGEPAPGPATAETARPGPADRNASALVQSDDERVVALARSVALDETDPAKLAVALEQMVHDRMELKDYTRAFDSAADVARTLQGDCTEHAILLAAVCRARGLPARVANGLVAFNGGFAFHMWTEVWLEPQASWAPLDATLGRGGTGAGHLKLTNSSLDGSNALASLLPVLQVLGKVSIEALEEPLE